METKIGETTIRLIKGDICDCATEAIVNAANNHLWMGAGVAGAIKRRGGAEIETEAVAKGPIPVGEAVVTGGGRLVLLQLDNPMNGFDLFGSGLLQARSAGRGWRAPPPENPRFIGNTSWSSIYENACQVLLRARQRSNPFMFCGASEPARGGHERSP